MEWILQRFSDNTDSTLGLMFKIIGYEGKPRLHFNSFVIEDEYREVKVKGETRIPAGRYELKIRKQDTPLTLKYRKRYPEWFQYHIELVGVPGYTGVYVHIGNTDDDTDGCLCVGFAASKMNNAQSIMHSRDAFKNWYSEVYGHLNQKGHAWITIRDESYLLNPSTLPPTDGSPSLLV